MADIDDYVSVQQAAEIIGCTDGRVRQMIGDGGIKAHRINGRAWILLRKDCEKLGKNPSHVGRPRNSQKLA